MKQKELSRTLIMISNRKNPSIQKYFSFWCVKWSCFTNYLSDFSDFWFTTYLKIYVYVVRQGLTNKKQRVKISFSDFWLKTCFNPLSPHDALKHHLTSLKTDLISLQPRVWERKFPWNWFTNTWQFSLIFKPHPIIFIHYKSRIATAIRGL